MHGVLSGVVSYMHLVIIINLYINNCRRRDIYIYIYVCVSRGIVVTTRCLARKSCVSNAPRTRDELLDGGDIS